MSDCQLNTNADLEPLPALALNPSLLPARAVGRGPQVLQSVKVATQLVQDCTEVVIIVGLAWAAVNLKDRVVAYVQERFLGGAANPTGMSRILLPVAGALNIGLYGAALLSGLAAFGVNTTPLLASLGASSVVIGLATQKILGDVASAITLVRGGRPLRRREQTLAAGPLCRSHAALTPRHARLPRSTPPRRLQLATRRVD